MHGLFNQLKLGIISIDNGAYALTPYMMETLSSLGVKRDIINLIQRDRVRRLYGI